jgi:hypothetical protein
MAIEAVILIIAVLLYFVNGPWQEMELFTLILPALALFSLFFAVGMIHISISKLRSISEEQTSSTKKTPYQIFLIIGIFLLLTYVPLFLWYGLSTVCDIDSISSYCPF